MRGCGRGSRYVTLLLLFALGPVVPYVVERNRYSEADEARLGAEFLALRERVTTGSRDAQELAYLEPILRRAATLHRIVRPDGVISTGASALLVDLLAWHRDPLRGPAPAGSISISSHSLDDAVEHLFDAARTLGDGDPEVVGALLHAARALRAHGTKEGLEASLAILENLQISWGRLALPSLDELERLAPRADETPVLLALHLTDLGNMPMPASNIPQWRVHHDALRLMEAVLEASGGDIPPERVPAHLRAVAQELEFRPARGMLEDEAPLLELFLQEAQEWSQLLVELQSDEKPSGDG